MAGWRDYWDPQGDMGDPTLPEYQPEAKRLGYSGYDWQTEAELQRQRQEWQARLLRENPEDMELSVQNPQDPNFKSPGERAQELEDFLKEHETDLGVFNK